VEFRARLINYADDFVILSRGRAAEALEWTRRVMGLGLRTLSLPYEHSFARRSVRRFRDSSGSPWRQRRDLLVVAVDADRADRQDQRSRSDRGDDGHRNHRRDGDLALYSRA